MRAFREYFLVECAKESTPKKIRTKEREKKKQKFTAKNEAEKIDNKTNFNSGTSERKCLSLLVIKKTVLCLYFFYFLGSFEGKKIITTMLFLDLKQSNSFF